MMDEISGASQRLCQLMGLPQREGAPLKAGAADDQLSSTPSTPSEFSEEAVLHMVYMCVCVCVCGIGV